MHSPRIIPVSVNGDIVLSFLLKAEGGERSQTLATNLEQPTHVMGRFMRGVDWPVMKLPPLASVNTRAALLLNAVRSNTCEWRRTHDRLE